MSIKLQLSRETEILELSEDVANESTQSGRVCPTTICRRKGVKIVHDCYGKGKFDDMLVKEESEWIVLCNVDNGNAPASTRERFTIAHELGHYHIPEHRRQLIAGCMPHASHAGVFNGAVSIEEFEADTFAANLLMPPARFLPRLKSINQSPLSTVIALRTEFDASLESTAIQAMRHDSRVVAILKWNAEKLSWHRISNPFFKEIGYRQLLLRDTQSLPHDSATAAALNDPETNFGSIVRKGVLTAAFCFGYVASGGKRDLVFREEAVRNGRFGVVSILSTMNPGDFK